MEVVHAVSRSGSLKSSYVSSSTLISLSWWLKDSDPEGNLGRHILKT